MNAETLGSAFAADAGVLVAAERGARVDGVEVDAEGAGADLLGDRDATFDVGGPHRTGQAVVGVVGDGDGLVDVVVGDDRDDGSKISSRAITMSLVTPVKIVGEEEAVVETFRTTAVGEPRWRLPPCRPRCSPRCVAAGVR